MKNKRKENLFDHANGKVESVYQHPPGTLIRVEAMDHTNPAGEKGVCMKVLANRAGMLWLAYQLMNLAYCSKEAAESGVHLHLDTLATPPVMSWRHTLAVERLPEHDR